MADIIEKEFHNPDHHTNLASTVANAFRNTEFTDVVLIVDGEQYHCHKIVLSSATSYFQTMFKSGLQESHAKEIHIQGIDKETFSMILQYIYTGQVTVNFNNVETLLRASDLFDLSNLYQGCRLFLEENISTENCLSIWQLADLLNIESLLNQVKCYALDNFVDIAQMEDFSKLQLEFLIDYVKNGFLNVCREEIVISAILNWLISQERDLCDEDSERLFSSIDLSACDLHFLQRNIIQNKHLKTYKNFISKAQLVVNNQIFHDPLNDYIPAIPRYRTDIVPSLIILGGRQNNGSWTSEVNCIIQSGMDTYTEYRLSTLPSKIKSCISITTINNNLYITFLGISMKEMWKYNAVENQWTHLRSAIVDRRCHTSVSLFTQFGPHVYVLGGCSTVFLNTQQTCTSVLLHSVDKYCISTNKWETVGNLNHEVCYATAVTWKDDIFVFCGRLGDTLNSKSIDIIQKYDTLHNVCTNIPLKINIEFPKAVSYGKFSILVGPAEIILLDLEELSDNGTCVPIIKATGGELMYFTGAGTLYDNLIIFGGRSDRGVHSAASDNLINMEIKQVLKKDTEIILRKKGAILSMKLSLYSCAAFRCANPIVYP